MQLIIVESPTKAKAIQHYLGRDYLVMACKGHIRNIRKKPFGVDLEKNFAVSYEAEPKAKSIVTELKKQVRQADSVLLATDPDREGEAIAWHLCDVLKIDPKTACRIEYQEVTKSAVLKALKKPRPVDMNLVDAALTRSILDYIVGFKVSPLLWKKVAMGLSAGRVQSPVLHLICEREEERRRYIPREYWTVEATVDGISAVYDGEQPDEASARKIENAVKKSVFKVSSINYSKKKNKPVAPFKTSTMQKAAFNQLGMDTEITMRIAQKLFEGISIHGEPTGLITYMRTDSVRVSEEAVQHARDTILETFGSEYLPSSPRKYGSGANAQDAHEAIRPTDMQITPDSIREILSEDEYNLYKLIYSRFLGSQMQDSESETMTIRYDAAGNMFKGSVSKILFPGYRKAYESEQEAEESNIERYPAVREGDEKHADSVESFQHHTKAPARYTQASMIGEMEEKGIGRPSTYASVIRTVKDRGYVGQDGKALLPRFLGEITDKKLQEHFSIFNVEFTKDMEEKLDSISKGEAKKNDTLKAYWKQLSGELDDANRDIPKWTGEPTNLVCKVCGAPMKQRLSKGGLFYGCSNYPACNYVCPIPDFSGPECKTCGKNKERRFKSNGTAYYICSNPECFEYTESQSRRRRPERQWQEGVELLPWARQIRISKKLCTTTRMATRISQMDPEGRKLDSKRLNTWLAENGYLEERTDKYGKKRFLPTQLGVENGIQTEDRKTPKVPYEIAMLGEAAQRLVIQNLKDILL